MATANEEQVIRDWIEHNIGDFNVSFSDSEVRISWTFLNYQKDYESMFSKMIQKARGLKCNVFKVEALQSKIKKLEKENEELKRYKTHYDMEMNLRRGPGPRIMAPTNTDLKGKL